jgi:putative FmdB family regulatory protein
MPTYGYECTACKDQFEVVQSIKDDPLTICQDCGGELRKKMYPVGIAFKGPGFYVNDYAKSSGSRAPSESNAVKADSTSTSDGKAASDGKADTSTATTDASAAKAETKSETKAPAAAAA